jgi:hypothetical protein
LRKTFVRFSIDASQFVAPRPKRLRRDGKTALPWGPSLNARDQAMDGGIVGFIKTQAKPHVP